VKTTGKNTKLGHAKAPVKGGVVKPSGKPAAKPPGKAAGKPSGKPPGKPPGKAPGKAPGKPAGKPPREQAGKPSSSQKGKSAGKASESKHVTKVSAETKKENLEIANQVVKENSKTSDKAGKPNVSNPSVEKPKATAHAASPPKAERVAGQPAGKPPATRKPASTKARRNDQGLGDPLGQGMAKPGQKKRGWRDIEALTERARLKSLLADIWHEDIDLDSDIFGETDHLSGYYSDKDEVEVEVEEEDSEEWEEFEEEED
jgi:hypothetical protein